jgi:hypothetical protein
MDRQHNVLLSECVEMWHFPDECVIQSSKQLQSFRDRWHLNVLSLLSMYRLSQDTNLSYSHVWIWHGEERNIRPPMLLGCFCLLRNPTSSSRSISKQVRLSGTREAESANGLLWVFPACFGLNTSPIAYRYKTSCSSLDICEYVPADEACIDQLCSVNAEESKIFNYMKSRA